MEFSTKFLGAAAMLVLAGLFYLPACKAEELNGDIMSTLRGISERMNRLEVSVNTLKKKPSTQIGIPQEVHDAGTVSLHSYLLMLGQTAKLGNMESSYDSTNSELLSKLNTNEKVNSVETSISEIYKELITSFQTYHQEELESLNSLSKNLSSYFLGCDAKMNDVEFQILNNSDELISKLDIQHQIIEETLASALRELVKKVSNMEDTFANESLGLLAKMNMIQVKEDETSAAIRDLTNKVDNKQSTFTNENLGLLAKMNMMQVKEDETSAAIRDLTNKVDNMQSTFTNANLGLLAKMNMIQVKEDEASATIQDLTNKVDNMQSNFTNTINDLSTIEMETFKTTVFARLSATETTLAANETEIAAQARQPAPSCQPEWEYFEGSCYYFSATSTNWSDGRKDCLERGADYVQITSAKEFTFVSGHATPTKKIWIGLNDLASEGTYRWVSDDSIFTLNKEWWRVGEPNNEYNSEDCVDINSMGFNDISCIDSYPSVCEMEPNI